MLEKAVDVSIQLIMHWKIASCKNDADIKVVLYLAIGIELIFDGGNKEQLPYTHIPYIGVYHGPSLPPLGIISNLINIYTHQIFATKDNPAADPRQMRRIIAEDPDWLVNISHLFEGCSILRQMYAWHCIVLYPPNSGLTIQYNRERINTIECNTMPCINLSEYWTILGTLLD